MKKLLLTLLTFISLTALSDDFVISTDSYELNGGYSLDEESSITLNEGILLAPSSGYGIELLQNSYAYIYGNIETFAGIGISSSKNSEIYIYGDILTNGRFSTGIATDDGGLTIINDGLI